MYLIYSDKETICNDLKKIWEETKKESLERIMLAGSIGFIELKRDIESQLFFMTFKDMSTLHNFSLRDQGEISVVSSMDALHQEISERLTVWKISFDIYDDRVRCVRGEKDRFYWEPMPYQFEEAMEFVS